MESIIVQALYSIVTSILVGIATKKVEIGIAVLLFMEFLILIHLK